MTINQFFAGFVGRVCLIVLLVAVGRPAAGDEPAAVAVDAWEMLRAVDARYSELKGYRATGYKTTESTIDGEPFRSRTDFSMVLEKPNRYLITWDQKMEAMPNVAQDGAVWNDGTQAFIYMGITKAYALFASDEMAIGSATGVSNGVAYTIPSQVLPLFTTQRTWAAHFLTVEYGEADAVLGDACDVLVGTDRLGQITRLWVSRESGLIRKIEQHQDTALREPVKEPEMTDAMMEETLRQMGVPVTEAAKTKMREMVTHEDGDERPRIVGVDTEVHVAVDTPEGLDAADFRFVVPAGVELKESLFGGVFGE